MSPKRTKILDIDEFAVSIGLSQIEVQMIEQKIYFINYLKNVRKKKNISQASLAKSIGTKQPAIARMEAGQIGNISFDFLFKVALILGVSWKMIHKKLSI